MTFCWLPLERLIWLRRAYQRVVPANAGTTRGKICACFWSPRYIAIYRRSRDRSDGCWSQFNDYERRGVYRGATTGTSWTRDHVRPQPARRSKADMDQAPTTRSSPRNRSRWMTTDFASARVRFCAKKCPRRAGVSGGNRLRGKTTIPELR